MGPGDNGEDEIVVGLITVQSNQTRGGVRLVPTKKIFHFTKVQRGNEVGEVSKSNRSPVLGKKSSTLSLEGTRRE